ncbi:MAG: glycosyltransferase family 4 protein [Candidatus Helarchaeota archaeon]
MKKKILIVTDSYFALTGFANVGRHIADYLSEYSNFEIHYLGWFEPRLEKIIKPNKNIKYYHTKNDTIALMEMDKYGAITFPEVYQKVKADIVFTIGDIWMIIPYIQASFKDRYTLVSYLPLDAEPMPVIMNARGGIKFNWIDLISIIDYPVAYTKWSQNVINQRFKEFKLKPPVQYQIPHGTDLNIFKPLDIEKAELKAKLFGKEYKDKIILGVFSRNQARKSFFTQMDALNYILNKYPNDGKNMYLYFHASPYDPMGWDMHQVAKDIGVYDHIIWTDKINTGFGIGCTDEELNMYYNACDITISNHTSEGWGLCILESMACGVPVLATDYSANASWGIVDGEKAYIPLDPVIKIVIPEQGTRRAYIDPKHEAEKILSIINDNNLYDKYRKLGLKVAKKYEWKKVCKLWLDLFNNIKLKDLKKTSNFIEL